MDVCTLMRLILDRVELTRKIRQYTLRSIETLKISRDQILEHNSDQTISDKYPKLSCKIERGGWMEIESGSKFYGKEKSLILKKVLIDQSLNNSGDLGQESPKLKLDYLSLQLAKS